jgi:hypothetical protein
MKNAIFGACIGVALAIGASAQDKNMAMEKMDHMAMMEKSYSGCVESSKAGSYTLTHMMDTTAKKSAKSMKKDDAMDKAAMAPASLELSAPDFDLQKYVGRRVNVTGSDDDHMNGMATFKIRAIKVTAKSCW